MREILAQLLIIGMSLAFLWVFKVIATEGRYYFHEPILWVLVIEITGMCLILGFGLWELVKAIRRL